MHLILHQAERYKMEKTTASHHFHMNEYQNRCARLMWYRRQVAVKWAPLSHIAIVHLLQLYSHWHKETKFRLCRHLISVS